MTVEPLVPEPDDKDWTWVLERPCPDCGFDAGAIQPAEIGRRVRESAAVMGAAVHRPHAGERPNPSTWSVLEYGCHVRDVCRVFDERLELLLTRDDPLFANWDQDETALAEKYWTQDPGAVSAALVSAADAVAGRFDGVDTAQWSRPGRRSNGSVFTVDSLGRYFLHDLVHHVHDVRTLADAAADVVAVPPSQWRETATVLADAFTDDPVFGWLLPDAQSRRTRLTTYFEIEARHVALEHGCSLGTADGNGIALVIPPEQWRVPIRVQAANALPLVRIFGRRLPRALRVLNAMEGRHLRRPHYYLAYIGVAAGAQGQGVGTRLITPVLERCDREGLPTYLEASNERCAALYRRLGFRTVETITPGGSPPLELMVYENPTSG